MESGVLVENEQFLLELEILEISRQTPGFSEAKKLWGNKQKVSKNGVFHGP